MNLLPLLLAHSIAFPPMTRIRSLLSINVLVIITVLSTLISTAHIFEYNAPTIPVCSDPFQLSLTNMDDSINKQKEWPCYVNPPSGYKPPFDERRALWEVPRRSLGKLNTSSEVYNLHISHQLWAEMGEETVTVLHKGGTSGRAFKDNFEYVKLLLEKINNTCEEPGVILDTGAGIGSVAAAMKDERGGNGAMRVVGYVLPDNYLRLQAIMSHRLLPSFLHNFTGGVPFPDESIDIVHCKWCWHHLDGYDVWLKEVDRVLRPGGSFVFTFEGKNGQLLEWEAWNAALEKVGFICQRVRRIVLICQKKGNRTCRKRVRREAQAVRDLNNVLREKQGSFRRRLAIDCSVDCEGLGEDVVHVGKRGRVVKGLLDRGIVAWLRESNIPVYPRSFDVVFLPCGWKNWIEVHRILRPGGVVVKFGCIRIGRGFLIDQVGEGLVLGWRMDM